MKARGFSGHALSHFKVCVYLLVSGPFSIIKGVYIIWPTPCYIFSQTPSPVRARYRV